MTRGSCLRVGSSARAEGLADRPSHANSTPEGSHVAGVVRQPDLTVRFAGGEQVPLDSEHHHSGST
jgi:hypothetical protein